MTVTASGNPNQFNRSSFKGEGAVGKLEEEEKEKEVQSPVHLRCHPVRGGIQRQKSLYAGVGRGDLKGQTQGSCFKGGFFDFK